MKHVETDRCGFDRDASLSADRYVCTCGYMEGVTEVKNMTDEDLLTTAAGYLYEHGQKEMAMACARAANRTRPEEQRKQIIEECAKAIDELAAYAASQPHWNDQEHDGILLAAMEVRRLNEREPQNDSEKK